MAKPVSVAAPVPLQCGRQAGSLERSRNCQQLTAGRHRGTAHECHQQPSLWSRPLGGAAQGRAGHFKTARRPRRSGVLLLRCYLQQCGLGLGQPLAPREQGAADRLGEEHPQGVDSCPAGRIQPHSHVVHKVHA